MLFQCTGYILGEIMNVIETISPHVGKYTELMKLTKENKLVETEEHTWQAYQQSRDLHEKCELFFNLLILRSWMYENNITPPRRHFVMGE